MEGNQAEPCRRHSLRLPGAAPPYPPSSPALPLPAVAALASAAALPCCLQTVVKCAFSRTRTSQGGIFSPCPLVLPPSLSLSSLPSSRFFLPCLATPATALPYPAPPSLPPLRLYLTLLIAPLAHVSVVRATTCPTATTSARVGLC